MNNLLKKIILKKDTKNILKTKSVPHTIIDACPKETLRKIRFHK